MKKGLWGWGTVVELAMFGEGGHTAEWTKVTGLGLTQLCGRLS